MLAGAHRLGAILFTAYTDDVRTGRKRHSIWTRAQTRTSTLVLQEYGSELCKSGRLQHVEHLCPRRLRTCGLCVAFTSRSILCQGAEPTISKQCTIIKTTNISLVNNHFVAESQSPIAQLLQCVFHAGTMAETGTRSGLLLGPQGSPHTEDVFKLAQSVPRTKQTCVCKYPV